MATAEELIAKYKQDRKEKLLKLQGIFSSQINQEIKRYSKIQKQDPERGMVDSSYISGFYTANDLYPTDELMWNFMNSSIGTQGGKIRTDFQNKLSVKGQPFAYLQVIGSISFPVESSGEYVDPETAPAQPIIVNIFEKSLLKLPTDTNPSIVEQPSSPGYDKLNAESYADLSKKLSGFSYPIRYIGENQGFFSHIERINEKLEDTDFLSVDSIPVITFAYFDLPDGTEAGGVKGKFNRIFPKPDGWDALFGTTQSAGTSGTSGTSGTPSTPDPNSTTGTSGVSGETGTSGVGSASGETGTSGVGGGTGTTGQSGTSGQSNKKYLSIEAIQDDDITFREESESRDKKSKYLTAVYLEDEPTLDNYYSSNEIKTIQTEKVNTESKDPVDTKNEVNQEVVNNEIEQIKEQTEAERKAIEAEALEKKDIKEKGKGTPEGSNEKIPEGVTKAVDDKKDQTPDKKPENSVSTTGLPLIKTFLEWKNSSEGAAPPGTGIIYRGKLSAKYPPIKKPKTIKDIDITLGEVERRYKSILNNGTDSKKFFSGIDIESPVDITLAMNCIQSGQFNKNVPYLFGEGSEIHLLMVNSNVAREDEGGIGISDNNANWGEAPFWCGIFTNYLLYNSGKYTSDSSPKDITGTNSVKKYYVNSPFNVNKAYFDLAKKQLSADIDSLKNDKKRKDSLVSLNPQLKSAETKLNAEKDKKTKYIDSVGTTETNVNKIKQFDTNIAKAQGSYDKLKEQVDKTNASISEKQAELNAINRNSSKWKKYNPDNIVAIFERGVHIKSNDDGGGLTPEGEELWEQIKNWPGGYAVRDGHVELLLNFKKNGKFYTIGGNTGIVSTLNDRANPGKDAGEKDPNGYQIGFKCAPTAGKWAGSGDLFIVKRGTSKPYTNGIGISVKSTKTYQKYKQIIKDKSDKTLTAEAFNIIKDIMDK